MRYPDNEAEKEVWRVPCVGNGAGVRQKWLFPGASSRRLHSLASRFAEAGKPCA